MEFKAYSEYDGVLEEYNYDRDKLLKKEPQVKKYMLTLLQMNQDRSYLYNNWFELTNQNPPVNVDNRDTETFESVSGFMEEWGNAIEYSYQYNQVVDYVILLINRDGNIKLNFYLWIRQPRRNHKNYFIMINDIKENEVIDFIDFLKMMKRQVIAKFNNI